MKRMEFYDVWEDSQAVRYLYENNTLPNGSALDTGICCDILIAEAVAQIQGVAGDSYYKYDPETPWEEIKKDVVTLAGYEHLEEIYKSRLK